MYVLEAHDQAVTINAGRVTLHGQLQVPQNPHGLVLFAHGLGSSRHSPRNRRVAAHLHAVGLATLLLDLLAPEEEPDHAYNGRLRSDVRELAQRLRFATHWAREQPETAELLIGYFGASTGGAATLQAAAVEGSGIAGVVTRGARCELAADTLAKIQAPTLLIAGGNDDAVAARNLETWAHLHCVKAIEIVPGAGHFFEEPGALDNVAALAARWFGEHLRANRAFG